MKKLLSVTALMLSGSVLAQTGYVGGGLALVDYSEVGVSDEASLTAIYGRLGTNFNENFSGEIRVGLGLGSDTVFIDPLGFDADIKLNNLFGVYVKGGVPISDALFPYVVLGYTRGEVEASALGVSISSSESDVSFGLILQPPTIFNSTARYSVSWERAHTLLGYTPAFTLEQAVRDTMVKEKARREAMAAEEMENFVTRFRNFSEQDESSLGREVQLAEEFSAQRK